MEHGEHAGFPDLAFLGLAVTAQAEDEIVILVQFLAEGEAAGGGQALTQGTGGLEDAGKALPDGRMALQAGAELTEGGEFRHREITGAGQHGVVHGRHVWVVRMSVDDIDPPGCPDFALHTILRMSRRTCVESS